jgi:hypothetical protein
MANNFWWIRHELKDVKLLRARTDRVIDQEPTKSAAIYKERWQVELFSKAQAVVQDKTF